jgi:hypothetical protein
MSILKKLSDVLKEVFWIKSSRSKKTTQRSKKSVKKTVKKAVKKQKLLKLKKAPDVKKPLKVVKPPKAPKTPKVKAPQIDSNLVKTGEVTHYFERIKVCVVKITHGTVLIGDKLTIVGKKSKFIQKVWSMQIESEDVKIAKKGQLIGLKVDKPIEVGDVVYK